MSDDVLNAQSRLKLSVEIGPVPRGGLSTRPSGGNERKYEGVVLHLRRAISNHTIHSDSSSKSKMGTSLLKHCSVHCFEGRLYAFEVTLHCTGSNGERISVLIYSKLATRRFPKVDALVRWLSPLLPRVCSCCFT